MTSFLKKGILVSSGQILGIVLGMLASILYSRQLGPDGMGQVELFRSASLIGVTLAVLGLGNASIYFLNNRKVPLVEVAGNALKMGMAMGFLLAICLGTIFFVNRDYFGLIATPAVAFFALGAGAQVGTNMLRPLLVAQLAAAKMALVDVVVPATLLVGGLALLAAGWLSPAMMLAIQGVSAFCALGVVLGYLRGSLNLRHRFNWKLLLDLIVYGLKLAAANILLNLGSNITVILLRHIQPYQFTDVGLYTRAVSIAGLITLVPAALGPLLYAKWSGTTGITRTRQAEMAARMSLTYGIVAAVVVTVFGKEVIWLLYGQQFLRAQEALNILAPAVALLSLFNVCNNLLAGDGRALVTACILAGTVAIITAVTYLAAPVWGIRGAALGALCGNAFTAVVSMTVCRRFFQLNPLRCLFVRTSDFAYIWLALGLSPKKA